MVHYAIFAGVAGKGEGCSRWFLGSMLWRPSAVEDHQIQQFSFLARGVYPVPQVLSCGLGRATRFSESPYKPLVCLSPERSVDSPPIRSPPLEFRGCPSVFAFTGAESTAWIGRRPSPLPRTGLGLWQILPRKRIREAVAATGLPYCARPVSRRHRSLRYKGCPVGSNNGR